MDEAELCDRVALMQNGRIMAIDTPKGITDGFNSPLWAVRSDNMYQLIKDLREMEDVADCYAFGEYAHLKMGGGKALNDQHTHEILAFLSAKNHQNIVLKPAQPTIEDCFIDYLKN